MLSEKQRKLVERQLHREESKIINIVLSDDRQVAGVVEQADSEGITLTDGRTYSYDQIREINGLYNS